MFKYLDKKFKIRRRFIANLAKLHFYGNPSKDLKIIGVTGTNGKTTITTLLYRLFTKLGYRVGLIGTVENIIIDRKIESINTTPSPRDLYKILNEMVKEKCEYVFMEVSSHGMDQKRTAGIKFTGGVFTNLTHDHLDYHKNIENYFKAKKKFFKQLPKKAFALSNIDDNYGMKMLDKIKARKYSYGFNKINENILDIKHFNKKVESKLIGQFNSYNVLAVYATAILLGENTKFTFGESSLGDGMPGKIDASSEAFREKVKKIIKDLDPAEGRFQNILLKNRAIGIIDYAHTPDALENVLRATQDIKDNSSSKIISIIGCGGDRDKAKRPIMAKIGYDYSDVLILTSDNPRNEKPTDILDDMEKGIPLEEALSLKLGRNIKKFYKILDRREAINKAFEISKKGDYILIAGKGHEKYQEILGTKYVFDDTEELSRFVN